MWPWKRIPLVRGISGWSDGVDGGKNARSPAKRKAFARTGVALALSLFMLRSQYVHHQSRRHGSRARGADSRRAVATIIPAQLSGPGDTLFAAVVVSGGRLVQPLCASRLYGATSRLLLHGKMLTATGWGQ